MVSVKPRCLYLDSHFPRKDPGRPRRPARLPADLNVLRFRLRHRRLSRLRASSTASSRDIASPGRFANHNRASSWRRSATFPVGSNGAASGLQEAARRDGHGGDREGGGGGFGLRRWFSSQACQANAAAAAAAATSRGT